ASVARGTYGPLKTRLNPASWLPGSPSPRVDSNTVSCVSGYFQMLTWLRFHNPPSPATTIRSTAPGIRSSLGPRPSYRSTLTPAGSKNCNSAILGAQLLLEPINSTSTSCRSADVSG